MAFSNREPSRRSVSLLHNALGIQNEAFATRDSANRWREVKKLGAGGFGFVVLWKNETNGDTIALKTCKETLSSINKHRWKQEVEIMYRLNHPNVVKAIAVPSCLQAKEAATLGMEWCEEGNLRQWFHRPGNQCGLSEGEVLGLMKDIGSAIEYLHAMEPPIIHRDIKPENVVLKKAPKRIIYKLIDLGYAKEAERLTVEHTFVGTFVYLAPELFLQTASSGKALDYWNFGTLVFEATTGQRPFPQFKTESPVDWHKRLTNKKSDHICCVYENGVVQFCSTITLPHNLTNPIIDNMTDWLRLMLQLDDHKRGGPATPFSTRPKAFALLDSMRAMKIVTFHYVNTGESISFKTFLRDTLRIYQEELEKRWNIPKERQLVLDQNGRSIDDESPLISTDNDGRSFEYYVIDCDSSFDPVDVSITGSPQEVQAVVDEQDVLIKLEDRSRLWRHSLHYCQCLLKSYVNQYEGINAMKLLRMNEYRSLRGQLNELRSKAYRLEGKLEFFRRAHGYDLDKLRGNRYVHEFERDSLLPEWERFLEESHKMSPCRDLPSLDAEVIKVDAVKLLLDSSPFSKSPCDESLQKLIREAQLMVREFILKEGAKPLDTNQRMATCVEACIGERNVVARALVEYARRVADWVPLIRNVVPRIENALETTNRIDLRLTNFQESKQKGIWESLIAKRLLRSDSSQSQSSDMTASLSSSSVGSVAFAAALLNRQNSSATPHEDSLAVIEETDNMFKQFDTVVDDFKSLHDKSISQTKSWTLSLEEQ
ncbi:inhibitor of nuclear factor kappa-B kinase subunit alpha-like isoform X2 [Oscarella lobularis]|uniref:inhibitor of nuclear factor kappa-B kinase subunit alpha-like isoform X2 n=1 Tax=Oscarella lobularis TaxID=121494 RepID=UPI003313F6DD